MSFYTLLCIDQEDRGEDPCCFLLFNLITSLASAIYYYSLRRRSISGIPVPGNTRARAIPELKNYYVKNEKNDQMPVLS